jgi:putative multiple sugar transport system permease protein
VLVALALVVAGIRARANQQKHGVAGEPTAFFWGKMVIFSALLITFSYLLASYKGLPNVLIVMALLIAVFDFVTSRTTIGRRVYALGGNEKAAKLSGIKTERLAFYTFINMVMGAVIGAFIMGVMNNGMSIMGIGIDYQQIIKGLVLLAAVFVDVYNKNKG